MIHRPMLSPVLVGRGEELDALQRLLDGALEARGATALVGGDAGTGKTRLCRELKSRAAGQGVRVIEGRCSPSETGVPYGPFLDALRFRIARGEGPEVASTLAPILAHVAPLFEELATTDAAARRPATAVAMPFERILDVFRRFAAGGPVLLLLEDIHWADPTSRDLLHYLARRLTGEGILLVATYRTDELNPGHPVHRLVAALARERLAHRIQLEPLGVEDLGRMVAALLESEPAPGFVHAVHARTDGNPLFTEELLGVLVRQRPHRHARYDAADLADATPPATIHEMVRARIDPLGDDAIEALTVASVIGRRFRFDVLKETLGWPEDRVLAVVERLVDHGVVAEETDGEDRFAFRHSLTQEVLYASVIGRRRRLWHRKVAGALERQGGDRTLPHTTLAHHFRLGGLLSRAREHAVLAGDEAARLCAWGHAEEMYEQALEASEQEEPDPVLQAQILEKMADVAWWQDRTGALEQYAEDALALRRQLGDAPRVAALLRRLANLYAYQHGDPDRAVATLTAALEALDGTDDLAGLALALNDLGRLHLVRGELDYAERYLERGLALAARHGDGAEEAVSLVNLARLAIVRGRVRTGLTRLELVRALLVEDPLPVSRAADVYHVAIRALEDAHEHEEARVWVEAAWAFADAHELHAEAAIFDAYRADLDRRAGRCERGLELARGSVDRLRSAARAETGEALRILGDLYRVRGDLTAAAGAYEEALHLGEGNAAIGLARVLMDEGRFTQAIYHLAAVLEARPAADLLHATRVLPVLVEAAIGAGHLDMASQARDRLASLVAGVDYLAGPLVLAAADGLLLRARGDGAAAPALLRAAEGWAALDHPYEAARARIEAGAALLHDGDIDHGAGVLREAVATLNELGADGDVGRVHRLLEDAGIRTRPSAATDPQPTAGPLADLTSRERQVLAELAHGRTNKQIGRALSITPKTVGNHVSSILAKLGCSTRTEASRVALSAEFAGGR